MSWIKVTKRFIRAWRRPDEMVHEVETELRFHIEMRTRANAEQGMRRDDAQRAALQSFGDFEQVRNNCCEIRRSLPFDSTLLRMGLHITIAVMAGLAALWAVNVPHHNFTGVMRQLMAIAVLTYLFIAVRRVRSKRRSDSDHLNGVLVTANKTVNPSLTIIKSVLIALAIIAVPGLTLCQTMSGQTAAQDAAAQEVLKAEREQREAYLRRDIAKTERLVADEFIFTNGRDVGNKKTLLGFMRSTEVDPTLTLTAEDPRVTISGDTAIVIGRRVERRRREDNNREGVAYARYVRTYIKRQEHWQLLAEHLETIPAERTAVKIDTKVYDDYVGEYESAIFDFEVVKDGERLMAVPKERTTTRTSQGRPPAELFPESEAEFFLKGRDAQVIFMRNRKGAVTHAIMRINGADIRAMRVK